MLGQLFAASKNIIAIKTDFFPTDSIQMNHHFWVLVVCTEGSSMISISLKEISKNQVLIKIPLVLFCGLCLRFCAVVESSISKS